MTDAAKPTVIEDVHAHLDAMTTKLEEIARDHLPHVLGFLHSLQSNPLVTAFAGSIPGEISADAMAILNGLVPLLGALGGRALTPTTPPALTPPALTPPASAGPFGGGPSGS